MIIGKQFVFLLFTSWVIVSLVKPLHATTLTKDESQAFTSTDPDRQWRWALGASYSLGCQIKFHEVERTGINGNSSATIQIPNTVSLMAEARYLPKNAWGFIGGLNWDMPRRIRTGNFSGAAWGTPYTSEGDHLSVWTLAANASYRWNEMYLPFGLSLSQIQYETTGHSTASNSVRGGVGIQFGLGAYIKKNLTVELISRSVGIQIKSEQAGVVTEYRKGYLSSLNLGIKYIF